VIIPNFRPAYLTPIKQPVAGVALNFSSTLNATFDSNGKAYTGTPPASPTHPVLSAQLTGSAISRTIRIAINSPINNGDSKLSLARKLTSSQITDSPDFFNFWNSGRQFFYDAILNGGPPTAGGFIDAIGDPTGLAFHDVTVGANQWVTIGCIAESTHSSSFPASYTMTISDQTGGGTLLSTISVIQNG
jgi:hypothetical protein